MKIKQIKGYCSRETYRTAVDDVKLSKTSNRIAQPVTWIFPLYDTIGENDRTKPFPQTRNTPKD